MNWKEGDIFDTAGLWIGSIKLMSDSQINRNNLQLIALSRCITDKDPESISRFHSDPAEYSSFFEKQSFTEEFIDRQEMLNDPIGTNGSCRKGLFDARKYKNTFYLYNEMAVEWVDGIAYRIGLGNVHVDGFCSAKPEWRRVELR